MADLADVETALAAFISAAAYPNGTSSASALGVLVDVERGWPNSNALDASLRSGYVTISVYAQQANERVTSRFQAQWQIKTAAAPTFSATVSGNTITFAGTGTASPQTIAVIVNQSTYTYAAGATDTPITIAGALAALVPGASYAGGALTVAGGSGLKCRVSATGTLIREIRRQMRGFQIIIWSPTPALRDAAAALVDSAFAAITTLTLADGSAARVEYARTYTSDAEENADLYRRDLFYMVEYATTQTAPAYQVAAMPLTITQQAGTAGTIGTASFTN